MKNSIYMNLISKIKINIKGRNVNDFIKRINKNKIDILKIENIKYDEVNIIVLKKDYPKIIKLKTIYEVTEKDIYGIIKVRKIIGMYKYILFASLMGICLLLFLSNVIFDVEVIHIDSKTRSFIKLELEDYDIKKSKFKKSFNEIKEIKKSILKKYKDKIEWLEIETVGTKYIVRLETRIIPDLGADEAVGNIIAKKSAIIKNIVANKGVIVKEVEQFVNKGDVVISGNILLNENIKKQVSAKGLVYGEVWYNVSVSYPYIYGEIKETGNTKDIYVLKVFNKEFELYFNKFKEKKYTEKPILSNNILPIKLLKQNVRETKTISYVLTEDEATNKAILEAKNKILANLNENEYIIDNKVLKVNVKDDKVVVDVFFSIYENITEFKQMEVIVDVP